MKETDAARVFLVRSVEEFNESAFAKEDVEKAYEIAGDRFGEANWFLTRAAYLVDRLPYPYTAILQIPGFPDRWLPLVAGFSFLLGMSSNYLGPSGKIHVLFNPILVLVAWNLLAYLFLALKAVLPPIGSGTSGLSSPARRGSGPGQLAKVDASIPWGLRFVVPVVLRAWRALHGFTSAAWTMGVRWSEFAKIVAAFWTTWSRVAGPLMAARWRRMLHWSAVSLAVGATVGIYIRGLFLDYTVVWTSTFVKEEGTVETLIDIVLGPAIVASRVFGGEWLQGLDFEALTTDPGASAAPWIHLYAVTTLLLILVPRMGLVIWETVRLKMMARDLKLDLDQYYIDKVEPQLKGMIRTEIRSAAAKLSERTAAFVAENLYQTRIVPEIDRFRAEGGRISDLKNTIMEVCGQFAPEFDAYMKDATGEFERTLAARVERLVKDVHPELVAVRVSPESWSKVVSGGSVATITGTVDPVGRTFADAISATVSLSIAAMVATLSGGLGESIGIAILVQLTAVSGPIGFLIGGLSALVAAGTTLWMGREKITDAIESVSIPAFVLRGALWTSRYTRLIEEGKKKTHESVKQEIDIMMEPVIPKIGEDVWSRVTWLWTNE